MTMHFGDCIAFDQVSINIPAGAFHALLGENGTEKSALAKCIMGFYHATEGELLAAGHEARLSDPKMAQKLKLGMVYKHFTLVPSLTAAENLVLSRADTPAVIDWRSKRRRLHDFMADMPFSVLHMAGLG